MNNNRRIKLAKLNDEVVSIKSELINEKIRLKGYSQSKVEAILCNALEDFLAGRTDTQHIAEFVEYNSIRNAVKDEVKSELH